MKRTEKIMNWNKQMEILNPLFQLKAHFFLCKNLDVYDFAAKLILLSDNSLDNQTARN